MTPDTPLIFNNTEQSIVDWALDYGITPEIIIARLQKGLNAEQAITRPMFATKGQILVGGFIDRVCGKLKPKPRSSAPAKKGTAKGKRPTLFDCNGEKHSIDQWALLTGIKPKTPRNRILNGWSIEQAISAPVKKYVLKANDNRPGVVSNFPALQGTGAGSTSQETPEITFSETTPRKAI